MERDKLILIITACVIGVIAIGVVTYALVSGGEETAEANPCEVTNGKCIVQDGKQGIASNCKGEVDNCECDFSSCGALDCKEGKCVNPVDDYDGGGSGGGGSGGGGGGGGGGDNPPATQTCGNGKTEGTEKCDDSNTANADGCSSTCVSETVIYCCGGSSASSYKVTTSSSCDGISGYSQQSWSSGCYSPAVTCDSQCAVSGVIGSDTKKCFCNGLASLPSICGNGNVEGTEGCDDGGLANGNGCSSTCTIEAGYTCSGALSVCTHVLTCGNCVIDIVAGETCDDGNTDGGDGCSANCKESTCTDTDSCIGNVAVAEEDKIKVYGNVTERADPSKEYEDTCTPDGLGITEHSCSSGSHGSVTSNCPNYGVCKNGACIACEDITPIGGVWDCSKRKCAKSGEYCVYSKTSTTEGCTCGAYCGGTPPATYCAGTGATACAVAVPKSNSLIGKVIALFGKAITGNVVLSEYIDTTFPVTAYEDGFTGWGNCEFYDGTWEDINNFCIAKGYSLGALPAGQNPCYHEYFDGTSYAWDGSLIGESMVPGNGFGAGRAITKVKCIISDDPVCGDGLQEGTERCDDENTDAYDGCGPNCICSDPDGGVNRDRRTTTTSGSSSGLDICEGTQLREYYCSEDDNVESWLIACPNGKTCSSGICTPTCTETDSKIDYYNFGTCTAAGGSAPDSCLTSNILEESYCDGANIRFAQYNCTSDEGKVCSYGACVPPAHICGNGILEAEELCDDGITNYWNYGDYCGSTCICKDSDGYDLGVQGTASSTADISRTDICLMDSGTLKLKEYYCGYGNDYANSDYPITCPSGQSCVSGTCYPPAYYCCGGASTDYAATTSSVCSPTYPDVSWRKKWTSGYCLNSAYTCSKVCTTDRSYKYGTISSDSEQCICSNSVCGNGVTDAPYETCDDGRNDNGDGCSSTCQITACVEDDGGKVYGVRGDTYAKGIKYTDACVTGQLFEHYCNGLDAIHEYVNCGTGYSCMSGACILMCANGIQNTGETDVDCGGDCTAKCADGEGCATNTDCISDHVCNSNICMTPAPSCDDDSQNQGETDVDCGGSTTCSRCADSENCIVNTDCVNNYCNLTTKVCENLCTNGILNTGETDEDCGGTICSKCAVGKVCILGTDCTSGSCDSTKHCTCIAGCGLSSAECVSSGSSCSCVSKADHSIASYAVYQPKVKGFIYDLLKKLFG